jgi:hypothetical protein
MKLRIRGDSLRLRLKRDEVDQIAAGTSIVEETHFPDSVLTYRLDVSENRDMSASFHNGSLVGLIPMRCHCLRSKNSRVQAHLPC